MHLFHKAASEVDLVKWENFQRRPLFLLPVDHPWCVQLFPVSLFTLGPLHCNWRRDSPPFFLYVQVLGFTAPLNLLSTVSLLSVSLYDKEWSFQSVPHTCILI